MTASASDSGSKQSSAEVSHTTPSSSHSEGPRTIPSHKRPSLNELINATNLKVLKLSVLVIGVCLVLAAWSLYERLYKPKAQYYEVLDENRIKRMRALTTPNLNTPSVLQWAMEAATSAYTFDFYTYQKNLKKIRPFFTEQGFQNFNDALKKAGLIERVTQQKLIVSSVVTGSPVVLKEGRISNGIYAWQIQFPMLITYQSQSDKIDSRVVATLLIAQVPTLESVNGIGIASFVIGETIAK